MSGRTCSSASPAPGRSRRSGRSSRCRRDSSSGSPTKRRTPISPTRERPGPCSGSASTGPNPAALRKKLFGDSPPRIAMPESANLAAWFDRLFLSDAPARARPRSHPQSPRRRVSRHRRSRALRARRRGAPQALSAIVAAMRRNLRGRWSAREIAGLTDSALRRPGRLFRRHLRESPRRWLQRERLIDAQSLITRERGAACRDRGSLRLLRRLPLQPRVQTRRRHFARRLAARRVGGEKPVRGGPAAAGDHSSRVIACARKGAAPELCLRAIECPRERVGCPRRTRRRPARHSRRRCAFRNIGRRC